MAEVQGNGRARAAGERARCRTTRTAITSSTKYCEFDFTVGRSCACGNTGDGRPVCIEEMHRLFRSHRRDLHRSGLPYSAAPDFKEHGLQEGVVFWGAR